MFIYEAKVVCIYKDDEFYEVVNEIVVKNQWHRMVDDEKMILLFRIDNDFEEFNKLVIELTGYGCEDNDPRRNQSGG